MTLMPMVIELSMEFGLETYVQAKAFQANLVWKKVAQHDCRKCSRTKCVLEKSGRCIS